MQCKYKEQTQRYKRFSFPKKYKNCSIISPVHHNMIKHHNQHFKQISEY